MTPPQIEQLPLLWKRGTTGVDARGDAGGGRGLERLRDLPGDVALDGEHVRGRERGVVGDEIGFQLGRGGGEGHGEAVEAARLGTGDDVEGPVERLPARHGHRLEAHVLEPQVAARREHPAQGLERRPAPRGGIRRQQGQAERLRPAVCDSLGQALVARAQQADAPARGGVGQLDPVDDAPAVAMIDALAPVARMVNAFSRTALTGFSAISRGAILHHRISESRLRLGGSFI